MPLRLGTSVSVFVSTCCPPSGTALYMPLLPLHPFSLPRLLLLLLYSFLSPRFWPSEKLCAHYQAQFGRNVTEQVSANRIKHVKKQRNELPLRHSDPLSCNSTAPAQSL